MTEHVLVDATRERSIINELDRELERFRIDGKAEPWCFLLSPPVLVLLQGEIEAMGLAPLCPDPKEVPLKKWHGITVWEEETWGWGWTLLDARSMPPGLLDALRRIEELEEESHVIQHTSMG